MPYWIFLFAGPHPYSQGLTKQSRWNENIFSHDVLHHQFQHWHVDVQPLTHLHSLSLKRMDCNLVRLQLQLFASEPRSWQPNESFPLHLHWSQPHLSAWTVWLLHWSFCESSCANRAFQCGRWPHMISDKQTRQHRHRLWMMNQMKTTKILNNWNISNSYYWHSKFKDLVT